MLMLLLYVGVVIVVAVYINHVVIEGDVFFLLNVVFAFFV